MAFSSLKTLTSHLTRHHPRATISRFLPSRATSTTTSPAPSRPRTAKVSDRIVNLFAIDFEGQKRQIVGLTGQTLLKALINGGFIEAESHRLEDIEACSAECEVHIAEEWLAKLPEASYDEKYVLKRNNRARVLNKHSRCSCQVTLTHDLHGMVVAVPEARPWDIP